MPEFPAITHVALTVSDLERSRPWYQRLFGADPVVDEDTRLDHLAFACANRSELEGGRAA